MSKSLHCLIVLFLCWAAPAKAMDIRICYESQEFIPYVLGSDAVPKTHRGTLVDKVYQAAQNTEHNPVLYRRPWKRCIKDLQSGHADAIFPVVWMTQREQWGRFPKDERNRLDQTRVLHSGNYRIFASTASKVQFNGKTFSNLSSGIGAPLGYVVYQKLKKDGVLSPIDLDVEQGFNLLLHNRLDGYVLEEQIGDRLIKRHGWQEKIKKLDKPYHVSHFYLLFSHAFFSQHPKVAQQLWAQLPKL